MPLLFTILACSSCLILTKKGGIQGLSNRVSVSVRLSTYPRPLILRALEAYEITLLSVCLSVYTLPIF
jgi:hypothetical protein